MLAIHATNVTRGIYAAFATSGKEVDAILEAGTIAIVAILHESGTTAVVAIHHEVVGGTRPATARPAKLKNIGMEAGKKAGEFQAAIDVLRSGVYRLKIEGTQPHRKGGGDLHRREEVRLYGPGARCAAEALPPLCLLWRRVAVLRKQGQELQCAVEGRQLTGRIFLQFPREDCRLTPAPQPQALDGHPHLVHRGKFWKAVNTQGNGFI